MAIEFLRILALGQEWTRDSGYETRTRSRRAKSIRGEEVFDRGELPDPLGHPGGALVVDLILVRLAILDVSFGLLGRLHCPTFTGSPRRSLITMTTPSKRVLPIRFTARLIECSDQRELATFASECPRANETLSRRFWRGRAAHTGSRLGEAFLDLAGRETVELTIPDGAHIRGDLCQMQRLVLGLKAEPCNQVRRDGNDFFPSRIKEWQAHCVTSCEAGGRARRELRLVQDEADNGGRAPQAA
jgi:hypothetical protein